MKLFLYPHLSFLLDYKNEGETFLKGERKEGNFLNLPIEVEFEFREGFEFADRIGEILNADIADISVESIQVDFNHPPG